MPRSLTRKRRPCCGKKPFTRKRRVRSRTRRRTKRPTRHRRRRRRKTRKVRRGGGAFGDAVGRFARRSREGATEATEAITKAAAAAGATVTEAATTTQRKADVALFKGAAEGHRREDEAKRVVAARKNPSQEAKQYAFDMAQERATERGSNKKAFLGLLEKQDEEGLTTDEKAKLSELTPGGADDHTAEWTQERNAAIMARAAALPGGARGAEGTALLKKHDLVSEHGSFKVGPDGEPLILYKGPYHGNSLELALKAAGGCTKVPGEISGQKMSFPKSLIIYAICQDDGNPSVAAYKAGLAILCESEEEAKEKPCYKFRKDGKRYKKGWTSTCAISTEGCFDALEKYSLGYAQFFMTGWEKEYSENTDKGRFAEDLAEHKAGMITATQEALEGDRFGASPEQKQSLITKLTETFNPRPGKRIKLNEWGEKKPDY